MTWKMDGFSKSVFEINVDIRKEFEKMFAEKIRSFYELINEAYESWEIIDKKIEGDKRRAYTSAFLFNALRSLYQSFTLFISGYIVPAGNLLRHFSESVAMGILISNKNVDIFERLEEKQNRFPFHKSIDFVSSKSNVLKIDKEVWNQFKKIEKFYDKYSHASLLVIADLMGFDRKSVSVCPQFDKTKVKAYSAEIELRLSAASFLKTVIKGIMAFNY